MFCHPTVTGLERNSFFYEGLVVVQFGVFEASKREIPSLRLKTAAPWMTPSCRKPNRTSI
jgi:hypothetical protein